MSNVSDSELLELFVAQLKDILWAEKQLVKALPKQAELAADKKLRKAMEEHQAETEEHVSRLERIFYLIDVAPRAKVCKAMEGLLSEGKEIAEEFKDSVALDAALICVCQKIEHYEMATYGTLREYAEQLGLEDVQKILAQTLKEEQACDKKLSQIATSHANQVASTQ